MESLNIYTISMYYTWSNSGFTHTNPRRPVNLLYCDSMHPLFEIPDEQITDESLRESPYVNKGYIVTEFLEEANRRLDVRATAYDVESIALLILSGAYIGFLPELYAAYWCDRGEMRAVLTDRYSTSFDVMAATSKGAHDSAALDTFLSLLRKYKSESHMRVVGALE